MARGKHALESSLTHWINRRRTVVMNMAGRRIEGTESEEKLLLDPTSRHR